MASSNSQAAQTSPVADVWYVDTRNKTIPGYPQGFGIPDSVSKYVKGKMLNLKTTRFRFYSPVNRASLNGQDGGVLPRGVLVGPLRGDEDSGHQFSSMRRRQDLWDNGRVS